MNPEAAFELRQLRLEDECSFWEACEEFRGESPAFDFALGFDGSLSFPDYLRRLEEWSHGVGLPTRYVPAAFYVGVADGVIVGRLSLRHRLNEFLEKIGGHIGYGVRPSQRRRGYATEMLRRALPLCAQLGIERALVTCDVDNLGSRTVIERCGGVFESVSFEPDLAVQKRRYWIPTSEHGRSRASEVAPR